jgi:glutamate synthase domain-containing protein 3
LSKNWGETMHEYRAYIIGPDGHIQRRVDLACANEETAREHAKKLVDGHDVELWEGAQKLARFYHNE